MSNRFPRSALVCFLPHAESPRSRSRLIANLLGRGRYLRLARLVWKLPTYARMVWGIVRDPRTPLPLKGLLAAALAYVVMPIDLVPDMIPIIGQADDLTVVLLVLDLFIQNAPRDVREEHAERARNGTADLDRDLARLRAVMGTHYDDIRDNLPDLLERYGRLRDPQALRSALGRWRRQRAVAGIGIGQDQANNDDMEP